MKKLLLLCCLIAPSAYAVSDTAAVVGAAAVQTTVNSGMLIYWHSQGVESNLVSTPTGTYVVPVTSSATGNAASPQNQYQTQNNQGSKQDFFDN